ncbi:diguanylate cyclase [Poseidonibacter lekithochrous]|uniref:diguanylate cyclase n=1 Tax=Poseidonibacter lekithochrous TaxID=1904463 RepID=UPI0008FC50DB|nr:diguanylate cyclase [Poseidonibacter lekithochrous]QKJ22537.1 multi-sensor domain-containing diguanylate cyclase [Poseidonibacter lekithochrous]
MINNLLKFFLLKNTLFLKIILVFTLPAIGMLYFSSVLVYEKIDTLAEVSNIQKNIQYINATQKLVDSLEKERGYSAIYSGAEKFKEKLDKQRIKTNEMYANYLKKSIHFKNQTEIVVNIKKVQSNFYSLELIRNEVNNKKNNSFESFKKYSYLNELLLDSIYSLRPIHFAAEFNNKFSYLLNLLLQNEYIAIERGLSSILITSKINNPEIHKELIKSYTKQLINKKQFLLKAELDEVNKYNQELKLTTENDIQEIRKKLESYRSRDYPDINVWWDLSSQKIDSLENVYDYVTVKVLKLARDLENDAYLAQILSLTFLLVSFITLISLLFVLRSIIFNEQRSFTKIKKQQDVYKLLNKTNKFLLKIDNEKLLFNKICKLISENNSMTFGFIYKKTKEHNMKLIAQQGELKELLTTKLIDENNKNDNLITKVLNEKRNVIIPDFEVDNISVLSDVASLFDIKSAAAFPIMKFNNIVSVLVLYSNVKNFFDEEIEILFEKMINDMTHALEKMDYEKNRLKQEAELRLASYAFESNEPMIITNSEASIINANTAFCNVMGYTKQDVIDRNPNMFKSKHQNKEFYDKLWSDLLNEGSWSGVIYNTKKNKEKIPLRSTITAIKDDNGDITHFLGQYIDISEDIDKQKVLEYQATHDNLTGLPNRLLLLDRIEHAITKVTRHNILGGLVFIDLDNFKKINDTLGHDVGDSLLIMVAKKIRETVREEDTIARIGGDEFIVLADCIGASKEEAKFNMQRLSEKIKFSLNSIMEIDGHKNISTPSIGVTLFSDASIGAKDIIKQADTAMYVAKKQGKNSIEFFD